MFLNFLLQIVHSTGLSDPMAIKPFSGDATLFTAIFNVEITGGEICGDEMLQVGLLEFWERGKEIFIGGGGGG